MIPFFPVPYLLVVVLLVSTNNGLGLTSLAAIAALGAAIGKFTSYGLGYGAGRAFRGTTTKFDSLRKLLGGSVFLAAFLFAALPLPDDVIFVPLGVMRYSPVKTFISLFTGKFVLTLLVAFTAKTSFGALAIASGGSIVVSAVSIGIVIIFGIVMMRVDWEKALHEGRRASLQRLARSLVRRLRAFTVRLRG